MNNRLIYGEEKINFTCVKKEVEVIRVVQVRAIEGHSHRELLTPPKDELRIVALGDGESVGAVVCAVGGDVEVDLLHDQVLHPDHVSVRPSVLL